MGFNKDQRKQIREAPIAQAVKDGKISSRRAGHYRKLMGSDPKGTMELLARLTPNTAVASGQAATVSPPEDYPRNWLSPVERQRVEAAGQHPTVAFAHD